MNLATDLHGFSPILVLSAKIREIRGGFLNLILPIAKSQQPIAGSHVFCLHLRP
jgi:hypothetical protein